MPADIQTVHANLAVSMCMNADMCRLFTQIAETVGHVQLNLASNATRPNQPFFNAHHSFPGLQACSRLCKCSWPWHNTREASRDARRCWNKCSMCRNPGSAAASVHCTVLAAPAAADNGQSCAGPAQDLHRFRSFCNKLSPFRARPPAQICCRETDKGLLSIAARGSPAIARKSGFVNNTCFHLSASIAPAVALGSSHHLTALLQTVSSTTARPQQPPHALSRAFEGTAAYRSIAAWAPGQAILEHSKTPPE